MTTAANLAIFGQTVQYSQSSNAPFTMNSSGGGGIELANNNNGGGNIAGLSGGGLSFSTFTGAVGSETYSPAFIVNSTGQVGIGTNSPVERLDVYQNTVATGYQEVTSFRVPNNAGPTTYTRLYVTQFTTNQMHLETADNNNVKGTTTIQGFGGNVALIGGLSSPSNAGNVLVGGAGWGNGRLSIQQSTSGASNNTALFITDGTQWQRFNPNTGAAYYNPIIQSSDTTLIYSAGSSGTGAFVLAPFSATTSGLRMDQYGNVSIGTATVGYASNGRTSLTVNGTSQIIIPFYTNGVNRGYLYADTGTSTQLVADTNGGYLSLVVASANPMLFSTNNTERMRITPNGNIAIGTSTDNAVRLFVSTSTNGNDGIAVTNQSTGTSAQATIGAYTQGAGGVSMGQNYTTKNAFLYLQDNASLTISTNATARMTFDNLGNVSIGTNTVFNATGNRTSLSINGTSSASINWGSGGSSGAFLLWDGTNHYWYTQNSAQLYFGTQGSSPLIFVTNNTERMRIATTGNVGIGMTAPLSTLTVQGGIVNSNAVIVSNTYTVQPTIFGSVLELASGPYTVTLPVPTLYNGAWFDIWVNTGQTITLSTPQGNFYGPFGSSSSTVALAQSKATWYRVASDGFNWFLTGFPNMSQGGNLTLGSTTDYGSRLALYMPANAPQSPYMTMDVGTVGYRYTRYFTNNSVRWDQGVDNGAESGSNAGSNWFINRFSDTGVFLNTALILTRGANTAAFTGSLSATGEITAYFSDARLKTNIAPITNAVNLVMGLNGVYYNPNETAAQLAGEDITTRKVGLLAQDVEKVMPYVVRCAPFDLGDNGVSKSGENYKTLQYERLVPLLVEAIKEHTAQLREYGERITQLERIITALGGSLNGI